MQIIKETIRFSGSDANLNINLNSINNFLGAQQEINNLTDNVSNNLINPIVDGEKRKFIYNSALGINTTFQFRFKNNVMSFEADGAGFTAAELDNINANVANSFFILDYYNSNNPNSQTKIFTTYLTKIGRTPQYTVGYNSTAHTYTVDQQFYYWYVPVWYLNEQLTNYTLGYVKLSFYNAKSGITTLFYNNDSINPSLKMYFNAKLDLINRTWNFLPISGIIDARELITSTKYTEKISNTINKKDNIRQIYPSGGTFNYETGKYI